MIGYNFLTSDNLHITEHSHENLQHDLIDLARRLYNSEGFNVLLGVLEVRKKICLSPIHTVSLRDFSLGMAIVLLENQADILAVSAAILYNLFDNNLFTDVLLEEIDPLVISIMKGVKQMSVIRTFQNSNTGDSQVESYRKMLLSIIKDVRIVLVKLSEQICLIRSCVSGEFRDLASIKIANEIIDIYAPLANRLGLHEIKRELEDRSLYLLEPNEYKNIQKKLNLQGKNRIIELEKFIKKIKIELINNNVAASVSGRVKNVYSIWKKMHKKSYELHQLFDISAVRVLVETVAHCYKALSVIHEVWRSIPSEYSDYIANPKPNGYQSIHTIVLGRYQTAIEVQIRTFDMHEYSENGVAAHWRYKEGVKQDKSYESRITWFKVLLDWQKNVEGGESNLSTASEKVIDRRVYAFTPGGDVIDMPIGSTVLDFAYNIHTMVGHRCKGAKVNGMIVPLKQRIKTCDKVQIITSKEPLPSRNWMNSGSGYIFSSKIRGRISRWFKSQYKEENAKLGKEKLLSHCSGMFLKDIDFTQVAKHFNLHSQQSFFSAIYLGDIKLNQVINYLKKSNENIEKEGLVDNNLSFDEGRFKKQSVVVVHGVDGLLSNIAKCCKPVLGDYIAGYVTRDKGVSIHRSSCGNFSRMKREVPERVIDVQWGKENTTKFLVDVNIKYRSDGSVLKNISSLLSSQNISLISMSKISESEFIMVCISIAVTDLDSVNMLLPKIKSIKNVEAVYRL